MYKFKSLCISICILFVSIKEAHGQQDYEFYISPKGNDSWVGSKGRPFKTFRKANEAIRSIKGEAGTITVFLRGGEYFIGNTIELSYGAALNSQKKIIFKAYQEEVPRLSGGKKITGWVTDQNGIYKAPLGGLRFRQLYVNDERGIRARTPNIGEHHRLTGWDLKSRQLIMESKYVAQWENFEQVEAVIQMFWAEAIVHLKTFEKFEGGANLAHISINEDEADILFPRPYPQKADNAAFHFENAYEFLDQPGEWYLDADKDLLFYKPLLGADIGSLDIIVPVTETLLSINGNLEHPVKNIVFEGLVFEHSNWLVPTENGLINAQAGMYNLTATTDNLQTVRRPNAAVKVRNAEGITFRGNLFQHMGATAIDFISGTKACSVTGNVIRSIAGNGITIGAFTAVEDGEYHVAYQPKDPREVCTSALIDNNYIYRTGRDYYGTCGIAAGYVAGVKIAHNTIKDLPYSGISLGYGWTDMPNALRDNLIVNNNISDVVNILCDGAGIYTLSLQPGTWIKENYIYDIRRSKWASNWPVACIYLDEKSGGTDQTPMVLERNSMITPDPTVKHLNLHNEGVVLLKHNTTHTNETTAKNSGVQKEFLPIIQKLDRIK